MKETVTQGEAAEILTREAKKYRNGKLAGILPNLLGKYPSDALIRELLGPYLTDIKPHFPTNLGEGFDKMFDNYVSHALGRVMDNRHMHAATQVDSLTQESADALLVMFVNDACVPMDLAFYAEDLVEK